jgi:hypothetical protein
MTELGETTDPRALIPGKPDAIGDNVDAIRGRARSLHEAGENLKKIDADSWRGTAGDRFRDRFTYEPGRWLKAGDAFERTANALEAYNGTLRWAQGQAAEAIRIYGEGDAVSRQARASAVAAAETRGGPVAAGGLADPGEQKRQEAREILARARTQHDDVGRQAAAAIRSQTAEAPEEPSWVDDVLGGIGDAASATGEFLSDVVSGFWEGTTGLAEFLAEISPHHLITDPAAYGESMSSLAHGMTQAVQHPVDFAKSVYDDAVKDGPGRTIGNLLSGVVLGGGALKGAKMLGKLGKKARATRRADVLPERPASSSSSGRDLKRSLASETQMHERGTSFAGAGTKTPLRAADRLAEDYGGQPGDWAKMSSSQRTSSDGHTFETHWYENARTGQRVEFKTKIIE